MGLGPVWRWGGMSRRWNRGLTTGGTPAACVLFYAVLLVSVPCYGKYSGGSGDPNDPFLIGEPGDIIEMSNSPDDWDRHFLMLNDIDLGDYAFTKAVISPQSEASATKAIFDGTAFVGVFDGGGHSVINLAISGDNYLGLFGMVETGGMIRNLGVEDVDVRGTFKARRLGGIVGYSKGTILRCHSTGLVVGDAIWSWPIQPPQSGGIGGLAGYNEGGVINDCYSTCSVGARSGVGGLVGNNSGPITNSHATGSIVAHGDPSEAGGLVGYNRDVIDNCFATGSVTGGDSCSWFGGLVGRNSSGVIINSYATGSVSGDEWSGGMGGLTGDNEGEVRNCYATGTVTGDNRIGGLVGNNEGSVAASRAEGTVRCNRSYGGGLVGENYMGTVSDSYAICSVRGDAESWDIGGLVGHNTGGEITNCYAAGTISGGTYTGGVVGDSRGPGVVSNCFWDMETIGISGDGGGEGKTTEEMKTLETFVGWGGYGVWFLDEGNDYPRLFWEERGGELIAYHASAPGSGTVDDPFRVSTRSQLIDVLRNSFDWDKSFVLESDIEIGEMNVNSLPWRFSGIFDGQGHRIIGLTIETQHFYVGLFRGIGEGGIVKNVDLVGFDISITGRATYVGGLAGENDRGAIENCHVYGSIVVDAEGYEVGGVAGQNSGAINRCHAEVSIEGLDSLSRVGGLVGTSAGEGLVRECYAEGSISAYNFRSLYVGGLVGLAGGAIEHCYSMVSIYGEEGLDRAGGLAGYAWGTIENCYAAGPLVAKGSPLGLGGLTGDGGERVTKSFWDQTVNPTLSGRYGEEDGPDVIGASTSDMMVKGTFTGSGWDFVGEDVNGGQDIWRMCLDGVGYPRLSWEYGSIGDFACGDGVGFEDVVYLCERWLMEDEFAGAADGDGDGVVDFGDFGILVEHFLEE